MTPRYVVCSLIGGDARLVKEPGEDGVWRGSDRRRHARKIAARLRDDCYPTNFVVFDRRKRKVIA